jgi:hypothetical protein
VIRRGRRGNGLGRGDQRQAADQDERDRQHATRRDEGEPGHDSEQRAADSGASQLIADDLDAGHAPVDDVETIPWDHTGYQRGHGGVGECLADTEQRGNDDDEHNRRHASSDCGRESEKHDCPCRRDRT